ncbi:MAG TPA: hypothetical protein VK524_05635, partial [Polyangiaceae bacterium]|nr:hypothetical protein [Polyangiaceae bacterium]
MALARFSAWLERILAVFESARARRIVLLAAVLLVLPSLFTGLSIDDYILLYYRRPDAFRGLHQGPFNLFWFEAFDWLIDGFGLPWWSFEHGRGRFMRPVTSFTHSIDAWFWPNSAHWMHLHSVAWFALVIVLAQRLYRMIHVTWVAGLACVFFALEDAHGLPVGWISNRNALIGAAGGFAALICHHRFRSAGGAGFALAGAVCFGLGLLSSELAIGTAAYLFAYAVFLDTAPWRARLLSLLPYAVVLGAWAFAYSTLGYGTYGLGSYLDPLRNTAEYLAALPQRWVLLLSSQLGLVSSDFWMLVPPARRAWFWTLSLLTLVVAVWFIWPSLRAHRSSRFWACGAALSAIAGTATMPNDRLLVFVGLGALAVTAQAVHDALVAYRSHAERPWTATRAVLAGVMVVIHLCLAALALPIRSLESWIPARFTEMADESVPKDPSISGRTVIATHVSASLVVGYLQVMRLF